MLQKQAVQNKLISSYKIDSEPDSDSDDEQRPKHEIPTWAKSIKIKLLLLKSFQIYYLELSLIFFK